MAEVAHPHVSLSWHAHLAPTNRVSGTRRWTTTGLSVLLEKFQRGKSTFGVPVCGAGMWWHIIRSAYYNNSNMSITHTCTSVSQVFSRKFRFFSVLKAQLVDYEQCIKQNGTSLKIKCWFLLFFFSNLNLYFSRWNFNSFTRLQFKSFLLSIAYLVFIFSSLVQSESDIWICTSIF